MISIQNSFENYKTENGNILTDINIIFADVKLIKCKFENLSIDISINNFAGLGKLLFMDYVDRQIHTKYNDNFFKKSLLLIKAWSYYEGNILGSNICLMATYALEILVIYVFNNYYENIHTELDAFFTFFKVINKINWEKVLINIFGEVELSNDNYDSCSEKEEKNLINYKEMLNFLQIFNKYKELDKIQYKKIILKYFNIIDPIINYNNLGKSVNFHNFNKIKKIIELTHNDTDDILIERKNNNPFKYLNKICKLFSKTLSNHSTEILFFNLSVPKIVINPFICLDEEHISKNISINKKDNFNNSFSSLNETLISSFNRYYMINKEMYLSKMIEESKTGVLNESVYYVTKEIIDYLLKTEVIEGSNIIYYDIDKISDLFNNL